jgi:hypothetical protein
VHEIALVAADTAERLVLAPLASRAARARAAGDVVATLLDSLSESAVADLVMGDARVPASFPSPPLIPVHADLRAEASVEVARLETVRSWRAKSFPAGRNRSAVPAALIRRGTSLPPGLRLLVVQTLSDADGRPVHAETVVLHLDVGHGWVAPMSSDGLRNLVREVRALVEQPESALHESLAHRLAQTIERVGSLRQAARTTVELREGRLRVAPPSAARQMIQAGLFDRRAVLGAARRRAARDAALHDVDARLERRERAEHLVGRTELAAALIIRGARL